MRLFELPTHRAAYSDRTAWLMATLSKLAYLRFEDGGIDLAALDNGLKTLGLELAEFFDDDHSGTQGFLAVAENRFLVLVFRGTEKNGRDIRTDLRARLYNTTDGQVHLGFLNAYEGVREAVQQAISRFPDKPAYITGHSLGGALATVATRDLEPYHRVAACYTFGSPRVGNSDWSDGLKTPVYRVVNRADGVPLVPGSMLLIWILTPLTWLPFTGWITNHGYVGYQHAGDLRLLDGPDEAPRLKIGTAAVMARLYRLTVGRIWDAIRFMSPGILLTLFKDHAVAGYTDRLHRIAEARNPVDDTDT